jgi:hypothetical protein
MSQEWRKWWFWFLAMLAFVFIVWFVIPLSVKKEYPVGLALFVFFVGIVFCFGTAVKTIELIPFKNQKLEGNFSIFISFVAILISMGMAVGVIFQGSFADKIVLENEGVVTVGYVASKVITKGELNNPTYWIVVDFFTNNKDMGSISTEVSGELYRCLNYADTLTVTYLPRNIQLARLTRFEEEEARIIQNCSTKRD